MRRKLVTFLALLALAGCARDDVGPGDDTTSAAGLKFAYRYTFRLPDERIAEVQEAHLQACERLGAARCRITGMRYTLTAADEVKATLSLALDPTLARAFGKDGIATVRKARGALMAAEIEGSLPGDGEAGDSKARAAAATPALAALTPVLFDYNGGASAAGIGTGRIADALSTSISWFMGMLGFILILIGAITPWALTAIALLAAWRAPAVRRLRERLLPAPAPY